MSLKLFSNGISNHKAQIVALTNSKRSIHSSLYGWGLRPQLIFSSQVWVSFLLSDSSGSNITILVSLTWVLSRSRTGFRRTDTIINRVIRGCVQTGVFVSIFAMADMFSFLFARDTYLYAMFAYPLGRIYTNVRSMCM